jgi:hypothetical protein
MYQVLKVFSHLPQSVKNLANDEESFKFVLKRFLYHHPLYFIEEYVQYRKESIVIWISF